MSYTHGSLTESKKKLQEMKNPVLYGKMRKKRMLKWFRNANQVIEQYRERQMINFKRQVTMIFTLSQNTNPRKN